MLVGGKKLNSIALYVRNWIQKNPWNKIKGLGHPESGYPNIGIRKLELKNRFKN